MILGAATSNSLERIREERQIIPWSDSGRTEGSFLGDERVRLVPFVAEER